ncbi:MAG: two-component system, cell cycle sensor histidine kinase and response regulator CckA [Acidimicrobiaceae bacterium]|nr:two-component system, cell cycle sensor histidine kinase and response regulator CckA [Acidimicrobiaceae bacterium]
MEANAPSPDWTARVVEAALDAIVSIDANGLVVQFNVRAEQMFGYAREEALGQELAELVVPPQLREAHRAGLQRVVSGGEPRILDRRVEMPAQRRGGETFPVELTVTRSGDDPPLFTAFIRDLSDLHRAQDRGLRVQRLLSEAEQLAGMGSWELDLRTGEGIWSDQSYRMRGLEPGGPVPDVDLVLEHVHPDDRERVAQIMGSVADDPRARSPEGLTLEYRMLRADGSVRQIRAHGRTELDERGEPWRWVGFAQDITDQRMTERELLAHYAVSQALRDWESFDEGVVGLLRRLGTALDFGLGSLWIWDEDEERLFCRAFWTAPGVEAQEFEAVTRAATFAPGQGVPGRSLRTDTPVVAQEVTAVLMGKRRAAAERVGLRTALSVPATVGGRGLAVMSFYGFERREPSERLLRTLSGIGHELGRFLCRRRAELGPRPLSDRELEVLRLAADGNTGPEIAELLVVSPATVKTHFEHIYEKLGVSDRPAAVAHALRIGLIQ